VIQSEAASLAAWLARGVLESTVATFDGDGFEGAADVADGGVSVPALLQLQLQLLRASDSAQVRRGVYASLGVLLPSLLESHLGVLALDAVAEIVAGITARGGDAYWLETCELLATLEKLDMGLLARVQESTRHLGHDDPIHRQGDRHGDNHRQDSDQSSPAWPGAGPGVAVTERFGPAVVLPYVMRLMPDRDARVRARAARCFAAILPGMWPACGPGRTGHATTHHTSSAGSAGSGSVPAWGDAATDIAVQRRDVMALRAERYRIDSDTASGGWSRGWYSLAPGDPRPPANPPTTHIPTASASFSPPPGLSPETVGWDTPSVSAADAHFAASRLSAGVLRGRVVWNAAAARGGGGPHASSGRTRGGAGEPPQSSPLLPTIATAVPAVPTRTVEIEVAISHGVEQVLPALLTGGEGDAGAPLGDARIVMGAVEFLGAVFRRYGLGAASVGSCPVGWITWTTGAYSPLAAWGAELLPAIVERMMLAHGTQPSAKLEAQAYQHQSRPQHAWLDLTTHTIAIQIATACVTGMSPRKANGLGPTEGYRGRQSAALSLALPRLLAHAARLLRIMSDIRKAVMAGNADPAPPTAQSEAPLAPLAAPDAQGARWYRRDAAPTTARRAPGAWDEPIGGWREVPGGSSAGIIGGPEPPAVPDNASEAATAEISDVL
jgi:hypothetical protein